MWSKIITVHVDITFQLGDIFTINVAGKWMTFVLDPKCYQHFFTSECVDFKAAVFPVVNKVGKCSC